MNIDEVCNNSMALADIVSILSIPVAFVVLVICFFIFNREREVRDGE